MNRYRNIKKYTSDDGITYTTNPIYPRIPVSVEDFYIVSTVGDRYDLLALNFYGDSKLWWIIASANSMNKASLVVEPGIQLRIPASKERALQLYNDINSNS